MDERTGKSIEALLYWLATIETGRAASGVFAAAAAAAGEHGSAPVHVIVSMGLWLLCLALGIVSVDRGLRNLRKKPKQTK
jgi:hypothetical protein